MPTFARTSKTSRQAPSGKTASPARTHFGHSRDVNKIVQLQRTVGNQAVLRLLEANGSGEKERSTTDIARFGQQFSRMAVHTTTPMSVHPGVETGTSGGYGEPATGIEANRGRSTAHDLSPMVHDFGALRLLPVRPPVARGGSQADIPVAGAPEAQIVDQPPAGGATPATPAPAAPAAPALPASDSCAQPRSMNKVTSGAFLGGLTMDSYYPDLAGTGSYGHPGTGGTFDTGSRVGANVQLYGAIASPCLPDQFHLEQTVSRTRLRVNGAVQPDEGQTHDDIAKSGRDATHSPFRQEFLGGGTAPLGYIISMADPPSTGYSPTSNIEHDRSFVTSLVGSGGRKSVNWSLSTRIVNGAVTRNVLT